MNKKILALLLLGGLLFSTAAHASSYFAEPYIGIAKATTQQHLETSQQTPSYAEDTWFAMRGLAIGARAGLRVAGFLAGLDLLTTSLSGDGQGYTSSDSNTTRKSSVKQVGILGGYLFPAIPLKVWGTFSISNSLSDSGKHNKNGSFKSSSGYRVGAGLFITNNLTVNLEYSKTEMDIDKPYSLPSYITAEKEELKMVIISLGFFIK